MDKLPHAFEGDGKYCQAKIVCKPMGDPKTTGVITGWVQCGYSRNAHNG